MVPPPEERNWEFLPDVFGGVESISDALVTREHGLFLLTDAAGRIPADNGRGLGLYFADTRHLSVFDFKVEGAEPVVLLSTADAGFSQEQVLGNRKMVGIDGRTVGRCTVEFVRERVLGEGLEEVLRVTNFNPFPVRLRVSYHFAGDFADIFEVRGHRRKGIGMRSEPRIDEGCVQYNYFGLDGVVRQTRIIFEDVPDELSAGEAVFVLDLPQRGTAERRFYVQVRSSGRARPRGASVQRMSADHDRWKRSFASIDTDNELFNKVIERSLTDLRMLLSLDSGGRQYVAAGTPWFDTLFGRDSLITCLQTLPFQPQLARDCLDLLARHQGQIVDVFSAEEPGKILHEMRQDELSSIGELPYKRYYGSVDSTPLFLVVAGEYYRWTGDLETISRLRPAISAALNWVRSFGATGEDGFLRYDTDSVSGLRNQGWKDSENAIVFADGSLCQGPIAMAEVQGYLYAAYRMLTPLIAALGEQAESSRLRRAAGELRRRFAGSFWLGDEGLLAMAIDGANRPAALMSSNAGQVLWSGILDHARASRVRDALLANDMFSGWGIRTLTRDAPSYNPSGYHLGSIWPHDNALIALGLKRQGFVDEANEIATALFDAACAFPNFRLPELFGGHPRSLHQPPVPYPVACRPQAWAAGATLQLLQAMLGLAADAPHSSLLVVSPRLPYWLNRVEIRRLRVGPGYADLTFTRDRGRTRVVVGRAEGVKVSLRTSWPA